jgi:hypothetical protein
MQGEHILMILVGALCLFVIIGFIASCKKVTVTAEENDPQNEDDIFHENITYIFKKPCGITVKNKEGVDLQFTHEEAVNYSKYFPYYKVQVYGDVEWHSCSTYFK